MAVRTLNSGARIKDGEPGYGLTDADFDIRYEGATLGTWEHNGYNDSDFYALVWTGEELKGVEYATTRGWTYANGAAEDATDEVKAAAIAWLAERDIAAWNIAAAHDALQIEKGSEVEIVRGRKVPKGTTGTVIWLGADKYKRDAYRIGVKDADGEVHWTAESNARATDAAEKITTAEEIVTTTDARLARLLGSGTGSDWVSAYRSYGGHIGRHSIPDQDIKALLAEIGRTEILGAITAAVRAANAAAADAQTAANEAWHAELDKPRSERDLTAMTDAGVAAGIYSREDADSILAAITNSHGSTDGTDAEAPVGATEDPGNAAIKGGSLVALAASIGSLEIK